MKLLTEIRARVLIWAIKQWSENEMDQWERWKMQTKYGKLYVTLAYASEYPDLHDSIDKEEK